MYTGRGRRTRIAPFTRRDGVDGARLIVSASAHAALERAVTALTENRFTVGSPELSHELVRSGSSWIGQDLHIGHPTSRGLFHTPGLGDPDDLLLPFTWSFVVPTLVIVCARPDLGGTELVLLAHPSPSRSFGREGEVRPLMAKAYAQLQHAFAADAALRRHEPVSRVADATCPASSEFVVHRLGWT